VRVLLVATNREQEPFPVAPLGALYVAAAARAAGHEVAFLDLGRMRSPGRGLVSALRGGTDAVAFGIRNLDNCAFFDARSYAEEVGELAALVRRYSDVPLILGGSGFSVAPRGWLERVGADYGVVGEGERAFPALLDRIAAGQPAGGVAGVVGGGGEWAVPKLDDLAPPAHELCGYAKYLARGGFVGIQTKRGCPFGCAYCVYPGLEGRRYRLRSPERVADEIEEVLERSGARHYFFIDSVFNDPRDHALAVCAELKRRRTPARWMAFVNPRGLDDELARAMAAAGCVGLELGLDAATAKMLVALHKPFDQQDIYTSMAALAGAGLPFAVHLLLGGPGETWEDVEEAQRFLASCAPANGVFVSFGIRVYADTPLATVARSEGVVAPEDDLFAPAFYVSPAMVRGARERLDRIVRRRPEWSSPVDWDKPMMRGIRFLLNRLGVRPQWRNVRNYGLYVRRGPTAEGRG